MGDHWYDESGKFREDIKDLRAARKAGSCAFVGASSIAKRLPAPALINWLQVEAAKAASQVPRMEGEDLQDWAKRAVDASQEQVQAAADTGTLFHEMAEGILLGNPYQPVPGLEESSRALEELLTPWAGHVEVETSLVPHFGVGGRCDAWNPNYLVDYKSQKVKQKYGPDFRPSYLIQKCLYRESIRASFGHEPRLVTIVIGSLPDCQGAWVKEWSDEEMRWGTAQGLLLTASWLIEKNYRLDVVPKILARMGELVGDAT